MNEQLSQILLGCGIPSSAISEVIPLFSRSQIPSGTVTLSPGERWNELVVIHEGIFRLYYLDSNGKESNKGFFSEGQVLAPMARSAIDKPSLFSIETLTDVDVFRCKYDELVSVLETYPDSCIFFWSLAERLLEDKIRREIEFLQLDSRGRYEEFKSTFPELHARIPLRHVASYLGMTDVTLSRIRRSKG